MLLLLLLLKKKGRMRALRQDEVVRGEVPAEVGSALRSVVRFSGRVIHGFGRGGKQLGFPTANLPVDDDAAPDLPVGIYYGVARVPEVSGDAIFGMAMSVGWNPYFQNERKALEVHVLHDFGADFYGATLHAAVLGFVRPEHNFASLDDLKQAIADDVSYARARLSDPDGRPLELVYGPLFL